MKIVRGTDITREMCSGARIPRGNTYHCNTGSNYGLYKNIFNPRVGGFDSISPPIWHPSYPARYQQSNYQILLCTQAVFFFFSGPLGGGISPLNFKFPPNNNKFCCFLYVFHIFSPNKSDSPPKTTFLGKNLYTSTLTVHLLNNQNSDRRAS